ncbi:MAG: GNAT family N-acetyltransferase [Deltaproteobacteria bacterium]|nr:GNAT family N-acetyltransferase [Deltaproteobacteria bacterium]
MRLVRIHSDGTLDDPGLETTPLVEEVLRDTVKFYDRSDFDPPWISYLGVSNGEVVGSCSFKGAPKDGRVEIAYFTFPEGEGRGFATEMVRLLLDTAYNRDPAVTVTARTLKEKNASHTVLEKSGFTAESTVTDPEDGEVLEWVHSRS